MRENSALDHLVAFLLSSRSTKVYRRVLWERLRSKRKDIKKATFYQSIYRLRQKGVVKSEGDFLFISRKNLLNCCNKHHSVIKNIYPKKIEKILISFDIPEKKKKTRDWLRNQIKYWDFVMIHKSLWLGYGPLPKEFKDRLKDLDINKDVRIFRIRKKI